MKHLGIFVCLMALMTMAFADSVSTERYVNWDRFTVSVAGDLYSASTVFVPSIFGTLRSLTYNNTGGADATVAIYNDIGTLLYNTTVAPAGILRQRDTQNFTIMGSATVVVTSNFSNSTSLATKSLYCNMDTNGTSVCPTGGISLSWTNHSTVGVGKIVNATYLDGINDVMVYNNTTALNFSGLAGATLSFWMKEDSPVNNTYIFHQGPTGNDTTVRLDRGINNTAAYVTKLGNDWNITYVNNRNISTNSVTYNATSQLTDGAWHHYAFTSNNTTQEMWIDGIKRANSTFTSAIVNASTNTFRFGDGATNISFTYEHNTPNVPNNATITATYDDFAFDEMYGFNSLLSSANISYLFNASKRNSGSIVLIMKQ